jgi:hypothetical protein
MKTKTSLLIMILVLAGGLSFAQEIKPGITAGVNFQNLNGKNINGDKLENKLIAGFHAGVNILMPIAPEINFQPGLLFSTKGASNQNDSPGIKYKLNYLELPLNIVYRGALGNNFVLLGFGPYLGYAINGNVNVGGEDRKIIFKNTVELGDPLTTPYLKRFDAGANIFAGYELGGGLYFTLNTQLGLLNLNPKDNRLGDDKSIVKNTGFGISAGFRF